MQLASDKDSFFVRAIVASTMFLASISMEGWYNTNTGGNPPILASPAELSTAGALVERLYEAIVPCALAGPPWRAPRLGFPYVHVTFAQ